MDYLMNRLANSTNPFQGKYKKVLCLCSAGLLRSPTTAFVLSQEPYNFNTRAAGLVKEFALIPVDRVLLSWADEIVCMDNAQKKQVESMLEETKPVYSLDISDSYGYRSPELIESIKSNYARVTADAVA